MPVLHASHLCRKNLNPRYFDISRSMVHEVTRTTILSRRFWFERKERLRLCKAVSARKYTSPSNIEMCILYVAESAFTSFGTLVSCDEFDSWSCRDPVRSINAAAEIDDGDLHDVLRTRQMHPCSLFTMTPTPYADCGPGPSDLGQVDSTCAQTSTQVNTTRIAAFDHVSRRARTFAAATVE